MKVMFFNSAWVSTPERFILRGGRWKYVDLRVRYCLILHPEMGPVLIDTGYTAHALNATSRSNFLRAYGYILRPRIVENEQLIPALKSFGITLDDINYVVLTHFHADHVSGLSLFKNAKFITNQKAWQNIEKRSYFQNLKHGIFTELLPGDFASRLIDLSENKSVIISEAKTKAVDVFNDGHLLLLDLPGHAEGQMGVLFNRLKVPLLYAVDAQWLKQALLEDRTPSFPARFVTDDFAAQENTSMVIRNFIENGYDIVLCHDPDVTPYDYVAS